jgi:hypothetical protein
MNFASEASKLLTNKYFLYFIVFLAATNVLGYLVSNKVNAVIFFALVAFLVSNFSKNMSVILLVAIIATNLLMANKTMREGLENANLTDEQKDAVQAKAEEKKSTVTLTDEQKATAQAKKDSIDTDKLADVDPQLGSGLNALKTSDNTDVAKAALKKKAITNGTTYDSDANIEIQDDPNNRGIKRTTEPETFKGIKSGKAAFHNPKGRSSLSNAAPVNGGARIDYATTLEDAYTNLEGILGTDGITKLTDDTARLMNQQQKLFKTMENMVPMVESAKSMMDSLDMNKLGGMADMLKGTKI